MIFHIPHSSKYIPPHERAAIVLSDDELAHELLIMTDSYADELFLPCVNAGDEAVVFPISRLILDPERFIDDEKEPMSDVGMGVVYTRTSQKTPLRAFLEPSEKERLIRTYYDPHHQRLNEAARRELKRDGRVLIIDCHSFPSMPLPYEEDPDPESPDICIGSDPHHTPPEMVQTIVDMAAKLHLSVKENSPFAGSMVPSKFYEKDERVHSIMIEIKRSLYMDETTGQKNSDFLSAQRKTGMLIYALRRGWCQ